MEGCDCTLISNALRNLPDGLRNTHDNPQLGQVVCRLDSRTWDLLNTKQEIYYDDCDVRVEILCGRRKVKERKQGGTKRREVRI
jgi:hypothetical protein